MISIVIITKITTTIIIIVVVVVVVDLVAVCNVFVAGNGLKKVCLSRMQ